MTFNQYWAWVSKTINPLRKHDGKESITKEKAREQWRMINDGLHKRKPKDMK